MSLYIIYGLLVILQSNAFNCIAGQQFDLSEIDPVAAAFQNQNVLRRLGFSQSLFANKQVNDNKDGIVYKRAFWSKKDKANPFVRRLLLQNYQSLPLPMGGHSAISRLLARQGQRN